MDERRIAERQTAHFQVTAKGLGDDIHCILQDVSQSGAQLHYAGQDMLRKGDLLTLDMYVHRSSRPVKVAAEIAWVAYGVQRNFGVEFRSRVPNAVRDLVEDEDIESAA